METSYLKRFGSRIRTKLNGIKRPVDIASKELGIEKNILEKCLNGELEKEKVLEIISNINKIYPIKISEIYLEEDTTVDGVVYCSNQQTLKSKRIICRKNKDNLETEYYSYYDCAMDKNCPFKPELIEILREVNDKDPYSPDVAFNRGHLETQMTFYINKVNFYYEVNNKKMLKETISFDSSIKLPYIPHTFTNRDKSINSKIIAVTFSNNVALNSSNLSYIPYDGLNEVSGDLRNTEDLFTKRLQRYLDKNLLNKDLLIEKLSTLYEKDEIDKYFSSYNDRNNQTNLSINEFICDYLNINKNDLEFNKLEESKEVIFKEFDNIYHKINNLQVNKLATSEFIKDATSFNIKINSDNFEEMNFEEMNLFQSSYYQFIYNHSNSSFLFKWGDKLQNEKIINPGDSLVIMPFVKHLFKFISEGAQFYLAKVSGVLNESILNEFSSFDVKNKNRLCDKENDKWW